MLKCLILLLLFTPILFAEYNDSIINYIFENRTIFEKYFLNKSYSAEGFLLGKDDYKRENIWQRESLFTTNANIASYYEFKEDIILSMSGNRKLMIEPVYFNILLFSIKEGRKNGPFTFNLSHLRDVPNDILVQNKEKIKDLLHYFMNRDSQRWNEDRYSNEYDVNYKGYAEYAVLAQLDSIYNYMMIPLLWGSEIKDILSNSIKNDNEFQKRRFISASEFLKIVDSSKYLKEKANNYIERTTDVGIVHYVNKSYSKEQVIKNFLGNPPRANSIHLNYIRLLGDTAIISEIAPYINDKNKRYENGMDFPYFAQIFRLVGVFYYDFNLTGKYFSPAYGYKTAEVWYRPKFHNNRPFSDLYSENYMDFMKQYKGWLKKKFGKELKREPQPDDIVVIGSGLMK